MTLILFTFLSIFVLRIPTFVSRPNKMMISDYFYNVNVSTIMFHSCFDIDKFEWMKTIDANNFVIYSMDGIVDENCELNENAFLDTYRKLGVFVDYDCNCGKEILLQASVNNFFNATYFWLFWSAQETMEAHFRSLPLWFGITSEVRLAKEKENMTVFYDAYLVNYTEMPLLTFAGTWSKENGLTWCLSVSKYERRKNLQSVTLKAGIVAQQFPINDPNIFERIKDVNENKGEETLLRFYWMLWDLLRDIHGFNFDFILLNNYGYKKRSNGSYDGLMGMFQRGEVDVSIGGAGLLAYRLDLVDFNSLALWPYRSIYVFLQPRSLERTTLLIYPFSAIVWLSCGLVILVASALILIVSTQDHSIKISVGSLLLCMSAVVSQQGSHVHGQWWSGRVLILTLLLFGFILFNYYSGQVVSELLAPPHKTITTLKQIADSPFMLAANNVPFNKVRYSTEKSHFIPNLGRKINETGGFLSLEEGVRRARSSYYAFDVEDNKVYYEIEKLFTDAEKCLLGEVQMPLVDSFLCFKKFSPLRKFISTSVVRIHERGLLNRLLRIWKIPKPRCNGHIDIIPVNFENASVAYFILLFGAVTGGVIFIFEFVIAKRRSFLSLEK